MDNNLKPKAGEGGIEDIVKIDCSALPKIGFTCQICGGTQELNENNYDFYNVRICDECKTDLKEIILERRNKK